MESTVESRVLITRISYDTYGRKTGNNSTRTVYVQYAVSPTLLASSRYCIIDHMTNDSGPQKCRKRLHRCHSFHRGTKDCKGSATLRSTT